jgi:hypothetical protein
MVRLTFGFSALLLVAGAAAAQERPYAPAMGCQQAAAIVSARGGVVIGTGPTTYERLVRDIGFCPREQTTQPFWTPTADNPQCFIGYRCRDRFTEGRDRD